VANPFPRPPSEATRNQDQFSFQVDSIIKANEHISQRLKDLESFSSTSWKAYDSFKGESVTSPAVERGQTSTYTSGKFSAIRLPRYRDDRSASNRFAFDAELEASRVYRGTKGEELDASLPGSGERSARWSAFSELSLGDISTHNVANAPVHHGPDLSASHHMSGMGDVRQDHSGQIPVTTTIDVSFSDGDPLALGEEFGPDPIPPGIDDGRAFTVADSGYGTASKAGTTTAPHPLAREDTDFDDIASVITDNLSLDLPEDVGNVYVREFVERILDATSKLPIQEAQREQLVLMLPDLLRAFALRVSFAEKTAEGNEVGLFTRKNKE
jgi:hypothetical protein